MSDVLNIDTLQLDWRDDLNWRDGVLFIETHLKFVEKHFQIMRENPRMFAYYRKGAGYHN